MCVLWYTWHPGHLHGRWPKANHRRDTLAHIIELFRRSRLMRYWAPVCIWMAGIFYFSSRPDPLGFLPSSGHGIDIDKLFHIGEYTGLAALLHRAMSSDGGVDREKEGSEAEERRDTSAPRHRRRRLEIVFVLALAYAVLDELHQELVPGRGLELADIGYDLAGIVAALGLIWLKEM